MKRFIFYRAELKQRLLVEWRKLHHSIVVAVISQWRSRLSACVRAHGGHFEHNFWRFVVQYVKSMLRIFFKLGVLLFDCFVYRQSLTSLKCFTRYGL